LKKETLTAKVARTYDVERTYRIYNYSEIIRWRQAAGLMFKKPKIKFSEEMKFRAQEVQKKFSKMSPEEEISKSAIKNCLEKRVQLISQLYVQLNK